MNYNFKDRTGERYGKQTVLERASDAVFPSGKLVRWKCRCDCGNEVIIIGSNLSKTKSCGCSMYDHNIVQDQTGKRFDMLLVQKRAPNQVLPSGQQQTMWECRCDCGSVVQVRGTHLKNGFTRSCGCVKSHGERQISKKLTANNIVFRREYSFPDCVSLKGNVLKFDFAIMSNGKLLCLIEFQGEQHYKAPSRNPSFGQLQRDETDKIKKEYCLTHNIPQHEIRYDENIDDRIDEIISILHDNTVPSADRSAKV